MFPHSAFAAPRAETHEAMDEDGCAGAGAGTGARPIPPGGAPAPAWGCSGASSSSLLNDAAGLLASPMSRSFASRRSSFSEASETPRGAALARALAADEGVTGAALAGAWAGAAALSAHRAAPPVALLAELWGATERAAPRASGAELVAVVAAWPPLLAAWPRHFRLSPRALDALAHRALPAAAKEMSDAEVGALARAAHDVAAAPVDFMSAPAVAAPSARDLARPLFALAAAEAAWRAADPRRGLDAAAAAAVLEAAAVWGWAPLARDAPALAAMQRATAAALRVLRDLAPRPDANAVS
jgi:hypothetical protein